MQQRTNLFRVPTYFSCPIPADLLMPRAHINGGEEWLESTGEFLLISSPTFLSTPPTAFAQAKHAMQPQVPAPVHTRHRLRRARPRPHSGAHKIGRRSPVTSPYVRVRGHCSATSRPLFVPLQSIVPAIAKLPHPFASHNHGSQRGGCDDPNSCLFPPSSRVFPSKRRGIALQRWSLNRRAHTGRVLEDIYV